jgi:hypothetical protein
MNSTLLVVVAALTVIGATDVARAQQQVSEGYDLFETDPGETDLLGIDFAGKALEPPLFQFVPPPASADGTFDIGRTDTIVHRLQRATGDPGDTDEIQIELVALSLESVDPVVNIHPTLPDQHLFVSLQKDRDPSGEPRLDLDFDPPLDIPVLPPFPSSMGQMKITFDSPNGGTFDSSFLLFADVRLEDGTIVCGGPVLPVCSPPDCPFLSDPSECASTDGCLFDDPCPALDEPGCMATPGCSWSDPCSAIPDEPTCLAAIDCMWDGLSCSFIDACPAIVDMTECESTPGCSWDGVSCFHAGFSCEDAGAAACIDDPQGPSFETFDTGLALESAQAEWAREPLPGSITIVGVNRFLAGPGDTSEDFWSGAGPSIPALGPVAMLVLVLLLPLSAVTAIRR